MKKVLLQQFHIILLVILISLVLTGLFPDYWEQQFTFLAQSFLHGKLNISSFPQAFNDAAFFSGQYYWPLGPFPAILLMPFVFISNIFGFFFYQKYLQVPLVLAIFYLVYRLSIKLKYDKRESIYLAIAFVFASVFIAVLTVSWSWQFAMVVTTFLIFAALNEYFGRRRYWVIGIIYGCLLLTRVTASLGVALFVLGIIFSRNIVKIKFVNVSKLLIPFAISFLILGFYNWARFGNLFEQGYSYQLSREGVLIARGYGLFGLIHLPGNLYYFLLASPLPVLRDGISRVLKFPYITYDRWGMGIFYTSPYFIYLFFMKYKDLFSKILIAATILVALPILLYYGIGYRQFGYRYSLDFLPYLFLLLIVNYKQIHTKLSTGFKVTIVVSVLFNLYLLVSATI